MHKAGLTIPAVNITRKVVSGAVAQTNRSVHADLFNKPLFKSLWIEAWGDDYPIEVAPFSSCTRQLLRQLNQHLKLSAGSVLVDLGCGTGGVGLWLAQKLGVSLIGIDRREDAIAIATRRTSDWAMNEVAAFCVGDFCDTGLAPACADAVISIDALPAAKDIELGLIEVRRTLRPEGCFIFTTREPSPLNKRHAKLGHAWHEGLVRNGFKVVDVWERPEVSDLWRRLYTQWLKHESGLRSELLSETVDGLIAEAHRVTPTLDDCRPWFLIKAIACA